MSERHKHRNGVECVHGRFLHENCEPCKDDYIKELEAKRQWWKDTATKSDKLVKYKISQIETLEARLEAVEEKLSLAESYVPSFDMKMYQQAKAAIGEQE